MIIGILTFYKVANFGANLQAVSTYHYLEKHGHQPILIYYDPDDLASSAAISKSLQFQEHLNLLDSLALRETSVCRTSKDIMAEIYRYNIDSIIVGSDAVVQHHPLLSRIHKGRRKPFYIDKINQTRLFPNPFWGVGIDETVPMAMMSVSSQNSKYNMFSSYVKKSMRTALSRMRYISVRDDWTQKMMSEILNNSSSKIHLTPDPVFAFNYNALELVRSEEEIRRKFNLTKEYILITLNGQSIEFSQLKELKVRFASYGKVCVAFPLPSGVRFKHPFDYEIQLPLNPLDWYSIIKYSSGYIGCNMHPIVVSLHNSVPCFSIDNWGTRDFSGKAKNDGSSKIADILTRFGLPDYRIASENGKCSVSPDLLIDKILNFPKNDVSQFSYNWHKQYEQMMNSILASLR